MKLNAYLELKSENFKETPDIFTIENIIIKTKDGEILSIDECEEFSSDINTKKGTVIFTIEMKDITIGKKLDEKMILEKIMQPDFSKECKLIEASYDFMIYDEKTKNKNPKIKLTKFELTDGEKFTKFNEKQLEEIKLTHSELL